MIALVDPELNGYYSDNDTDELQNRIKTYILKSSHIHRIDWDDISTQMYETTAAVIERLQLVRLWGYGFPDIPLYVYILRRYIK